MSLTCATKQQTKKKPISFDWPIAIENPIIATWIGHTFKVSGSDCPIRGLCVAAALRSHQQTAGYHPLKRHLCKKSLKLYNVCLDLSCFPR